MLNLSSRKVRYVYFTSIAFSVSLVPAFAQIAFPNFLLANGTSTKTVGFFTSLVGLPWALQFLWSSVVDYFPNFKMGSKRFWIVIPGLLSSLTLVPLIWLKPDPDSLSEIVACFILYAIFSSTLNVAADGLMVDKVENKESGRIAASITAGAAVSTAFSTWVFSWLLGNRGFHVATEALLSANIFFNALIILIKDADRSDTFSFATQVSSLEADFKNRFSLNALRSFFAKTSILSFIAIVFSISFLFAYLQLNLSAQLIQNLHWTQSELGRVEGSCILFSGTLGSMMMGILSDRKGHFRTLFRLIICLGVTFMLLGVISYFFFAEKLVPALLFHQELFGSLIFVAILPVAMILSRGEFSASKYMFLMAAMNLGDICGSAMGGYLPIQSNLRTFVFGMVITLFWLAIMLKNQVQRRMGELDDPALI